MRICLYTDTALPKIGGQEFVVDALARQFQHLGHDVTVLAPYPRLPLLPRDRELPYPVVRHPRFFSTRWLVPMHRCWLLRLHRRVRFDVLHCHGLYPPGYLAAITRSRIRTPVILTSHGGDVRSDSDRNRRNVIRQRLCEGLRRADALVAISRMTHEGYITFGADPEKIVAIPNGVHLEPFAGDIRRPGDLDPGITEGGYLLFLGRLKYRKGVDLLLRALSLLPATGNVEAVIAGDGEERAQLERLSAALHLQDRVRFVGTAAGATKAYLLRHARCTVIPSRISEAFPLVALESYAAGTPVIATRLRGLEDLVQPGRTGWLVPPESPKQLAAALQQTTGPEGGLAGRRSQVREVAERHSWQAVARLHVELYMRLLREPFVQQVV